jgi:quinolinate synthase
MDTFEEINLKGFADEYIDPSLDLFTEIDKLKKEKNAVILAHYYQEPDIQDIADYIGDSLGLSQQAAKTDADIIVFAGVHFMAETAKILSPSKKVLLPDIKAGCSLADSCPPHLFKKFKEQYPDHLVITYVNCTAELKAMIIFGPDKNLGAYVAKKTGRDLVLWNGACMVHEIFSREKITKLKERHPGAKLLAHPECEDVILQMADYIGSTTGILKYASKHPDKEFIVATEAGIIHQMQKENPDKVFIPAPPNNNCACNDCPHMKRNTLEKLYLCIKNELPEIYVPQHIIEKAVKPIERMLEISARLGL